MSYGLGEFELGGFPLDRSLSVRDPLSGLINDPSRPRAFLFRGTPTSGGVAQSVDLSARGGIRGSYVSHPVDSPYKVFPEAIVRPYNFSVTLPDGDGESAAPLAGGASLGLGELVISNSDGSLDSAALYDWLGAQADVYLGEPDAALTTFTRFFRGISAGDSWDLDSIRILHRDRRFQLQRRLQQNRYLGFGTALSGDGAATYGTCTLACPAGSMTLECRFNLDTNDTTLRYLMGYQVSATAGVRALRMNTGGTNVLNFVVVNDAAGQFNISYTGVTAGTWRTASGVLDTTAMQLRLLVDGVEVATPVAVTGTFNTVLSAYTVMRRPDVASNWLPGDFDEARIWNVARSTADILRDSSRVLVGTETGLYSLHRFEEGSGTAAGNSVATRPSLTLTSPTWIGSLEGDISLAGIVKAKAFGKRRQVGPRLVDSQRLVYQLHDGAMQAVDAVRDSGDLLTFGTNLADIYSAAPGAGVYNTCLAKGLIRLGSTPVGTITCDIQGDNSGALGYTQTTGTIHRKLMTQFGGLSDPVDLDTGAYLLMEVINPAVTGFYFDEEIHIDEAADQVMSNISGWWSPTRAGQITLGRIDDPSVSTPTVSFGANDIDQSAGEPYRRDPWGVRVGEVVIGYRPYHTVLSADQVAGAVTLAARDDFGKDYRYKSAQDPLRSADAKIMTILTSIDDETAAQAEADRLLALWKVERDRIALALTGGNLAYYVGALVSLEIQQVTTAGATISRYNTSGGKRYVVVGLTEDMGEHGSPDRLSVTLMG